MSKHRARVGVFGAAAIALAGLLGGPLKRAQGQEISVRALTNVREVYVGQAFRFNIQVQGSDSPQAPDLSVLKEFRVEKRGGRQVILNARRSYTFFYQLTPSLLGVRAAPSLARFKRGDASRAVRSGNRYIS